MTAIQIRADRRKLASLALIPISLILIVIFTVLDIRTATEPPFLLTLLNTVFIGLIPLVIAAIAFRSYRSGGSAGLLMMGSGMMIFGLGSIAAGWLIGLSGGANISVAIYNVCIFVSSIFYLTGALHTFTRSETPATTGSTGKIAAISAGIVIFVAVSIFFIIAGIIPPFFIAGSGPTVLRQVILSSAIAFLAVAAILLVHIYIRKREDFFFWYSVSLAVIMIGLIGAFLTPALGSPVNWVSRAMQYIGAGFALVAIIVAGWQARDRGHSLEDTLSRFFSEAEAGYKSLIETATDAIVVFDSEDRVIVWNRAAEKMFGYNTVEALGSSFFTMAIPDRFIDLIKSNFTTPAGARADENTHQPMEVVARRKDGSTFPAEISLSRHQAAGTWDSTCIIRDITERKRSKEVLQENESILQSFFNVRGAMRGIVEVVADDDVLHLMDNVITADFIGRTPEELKNMLGSEIGEPTDILRIWVGHYRESQRSGSPVTFEYVDKRGDHEAWLQATVSYLGMPGVFPRFAYVVADITEQKKAEAKVLESYRTLSELIESAPFGIYVIDSQFRIAMMNIGSQNNAFRNVRPLIGRNFSEAMHTLWPDDVAEEILGHFRHTLKTGEPYHSPRFTSQRNDVELVESYEWELRRITLPDGQVGVICYYFDSTEIRNAEEAVRVSEERYHNLFSVMPSGVAVYEVRNNGDDPEGRDFIFKDMNPAGEKIDQVHRAEIVGKSLYDFFPSVREIGLPVVFKRVYQTGMPEFFPVTLYSDNKISLWVTNYVWRLPSGELVALFDDITERKRVEEVLAFQARLLSDVHDAVFSSNSSYAITYWNQAAEKMFGWTKEEVLGKNSGELLKPIVANSSRDQERAKLRSAGHWEGEVQYIRKDGTFLLVEVNSTVLTDLEEKDKGRVVVARDITDRKRAEEALAAAHKRTTTILEGIADTFYSVDDQWRFVMVNPAAEKAPFGRPAAEMLGKIIWDLYPALVGTQIHQYYLDAAAKQKLEHYEALSPLNSRWYEVFMQGRDGGVDVYMRDITQRKQVEEALRESEEKFRVLTENLQSAVALIDEKGAFSIVNASFLRMFAIPADADILNVNSQDWVRWKVFNEDGTPLDVDQHPVRKAALTGRAVRNQLVAMKSPAGPDLKWLLISAEPILDVHGRIHRIICTYYDITDRKNVEEALKRKNEDLNAAYEEITSKEEELQQNVTEITLREEELRKALAEKEVLLAEIHHRVKNNLTAFISLLSLEGSVEETPSGLELKKDLQNRARSMALIHETLYKTHQFSEVDMEQYLGPLVEQVVNSYASPRSIRTVIEAKGVSLDLARATPAGLIVNELVTNSLKHGFPKEVISCRADQKDSCTIGIRLTKENGTYMLSVFDTGIGMPAGFDPLTAKSLGLKLVTFLAKHQMRAKIEVKTGKGTEFVFRFRE